MLPVRCFYCKKKYDRGSDVVTHSIAEHANEELCILRASFVPELSRIKYHACHYGVKPCDFSNYDFNDETFQFRFCKLNIQDFESPVCKKNKFSVTPSKLKHLDEGTNFDKSNFSDSEESSNASDVEMELQGIDYLSKDEGTQTESVCIISIDSLSKEDKETIVELQEIFPVMISELKKIGHLDDWANFIKLLENGKFPTDNLSFKLFMDVVRWFKGETVHSMRYSPTVKRFWALGYTLFKDKFLRFMGGFKCKGQIIGNFNKERQLLPQNSDINFVVPNRHSLVHEISEGSVRCDKPGILEKNIEIFSEVNAGNSCKICLDGKKIATGFGKKLGDVDLFGHEEKPTLEERETRIESEKSCIEKVSKFLSLETLKGILKVNEIVLSPTKSMELLTLLHDVRLILSERLKELRKLILKKKIALKHLLNCVGNEVNWQDSKLCYAISAVQTNIYRTKECINDIVICLNGIGESIACLNKCEHYCNQRNVDMSKQKNYVCLKGMSEDLLSQPEMLLMYSKFTQQRTPAWFDLRKKGKITGSTLNAALGLDSLKKQCAHFDEFILGVPSQAKTTPIIEQAKEHGTINEPNAVATTVGKILPVLQPDIHFFEIGSCILYQDGKPFMIISPDGQGKTGINDSPRIAFEIKCPMPGKKFCPDVHYSIPRYYVPQILSEMKALNCEKLFYICYTTHTTTVFEVEFDSNIWELMWKMSLEIYGIQNPVRPKKKSKETFILSDAITKFLQDKVSYHGEFPSATAFNCKHEEIKNPDEVYGFHGNDGINNNKTSAIVSLNDLQQTLFKASKNLAEAYTLLRLPAKEVIVALITDMNRNKKGDIPHAIPIGYGLSGHSLKVDCVRNMLLDILVKCNNYNLHVPVVSYDGQFYRLAVRDAKGNPLTILQLQKDTWDKAKKMSKSQHISYITSANCMPHATNIRQLEKHVNITYSIKNVEGHPRIFGPIIVSSLKDESQGRLLIPKGIEKWIVRDQKESKEKENLLDEAVCDDDYNIIVSCLPSSVLDAIGEEALKTIKKVTKNIPKSVLGEGNHSSAADIDVDVLFQNCEEETPSKSQEENIEIPVTAKTNDSEIIEEHFKEQNNIIIEEIDFETMLTALQNNSNKQRAAKWKDLSIHKFKEVMSTAETINKSLFLDELVLIISAIKHKLSKRNLMEKLSKRKKYELVNELCDIFGDKSKIKSIRKRNPPSLKCRVKDEINRKFSKMATNIIIATNEFHQKALPGWQSQSPFRKSSVVEGYEEPYVWYSQPEFIPETKCNLYSLLDCHHLFVNARCTVCKKGLPGMAIDKNGWKHIAQNSRENKTGLSLSMVDDLIDRQSNAIAQKTFSEVVEKELIKAGYMNEGILCKVIRNWYRAEDEAGLTVNERMQYRLDIRKWMLQNCGIGRFPPPGSHVNSIPIVMFEGILTNIDRRIQLFAEAKNGSYNVRSLGSLDSETFFSTFQDMDPKGSGVLLPDDIPKVMQTASFITQAHFDQERY